MKQCKVCGEFKPLGQYRKRNGSKGIYYSGICKDCVHKQQKEYWQNKVKDEQYKEKRRKDVNKAVNKYNQTDKGKQYRIKAEQLRIKSSKIYVKVCEETGKLFVARYKNAKRSKEGYKIYMSKRNKNKYWKYNDSHKTCVVCGKKYDYLMQGSISYCSNDCKKEAKRVHDRNRKAIIRRSVYNQIHERINHIKVFNRDKWICRICGCKTPLRLKGTIDDNAPELDHIVPLSKGGQHTYANVQCLCRKCNQKKGNKLIGQQILCI